MQTLAKAHLIILLFLPVTFSFADIDIDASKFTISYSGDQFLTPGEGLELSVSHPAGAPADIVWEQYSENGQASEIGRGNTVRLVAPSLSQPCESKQVKIGAKITSDRNSAEKFATFTVMNPICNMSSADGLINSSCTRVAIRNNRVAVGTDRGVMIFDGQEWTSFLSAGKKRPLGEISALAWEDNGTLWVGNSVTNYLPFPVTLGLGVERLRKGNIWDNTEISNKTGLEGMLPQFIRFDDPYVIIGTKSDLNSSALFASGGITVGSESFSATNVILSNADVYSTAAGKTGERWYGTKNGVYVYKKDAQIRHYDGREWHGKGTIYSNTSVKSIVRDHETMWFGLEGGYFGAGGLVSFANGTWSDIQHLPASASDDIRSMTIDNHGNLWIGTSRGLVLRRGADSSFTVFTTQQGLGSIDVRDVAFEASTNTLWVATSHGLTRIHLDLLGLK